MSVSRKAALVVGLAVTGPALLGCPPEVECRNYSDCAVGQLCDPATNRCVADPNASGGGGGVNPPPPGDGGPPGDAGVNVEAQLRPTYPAPWIARDPRPGGQDHILFPDLYADGSGNIVTDELRSFDPATGRLDPAPLVDFLQTPGGACALESLLFVTGTDPDETWLSCGVGAGLRIVYDGDFAQDSFNIPGARAEIALFTTPSGNNEYPRVIVAGRGGGSLHSYQLRDTDGLLDGHMADTFSVGFGAVADLFPVDRTTLPGDFALVFDRAALGAGGDPALVPIQRDPQAELWRAADGPLDTFALPAETHVALLLGPVRADMQTPTPNTPNVMSLEPSTGLARFWSFETGQELPPHTTYETDSRFLVDAPDPTARTLLARSPSGRYVFYTLPNTYQLWRIPTSPGGDNDVLRYELTHAAWRPSGLVAETDDTVWVSYANENLIERIRFTSP